MSQKTARIHAVVGLFQGRDLDAHYLGYVDCFNRELFYEAHEVLEQLWLAHRAGPKERFYKGLIQLAGAFVHLQWDRPRPAAALLRLARANLEGYPGICDQLDVTGVQRMIDGWLLSLDSDGGATRLPSAAPAPKLRLLNCGFER